MFSHPNKAGLTAAIAATITIAGALGGCASAPVEELSTSQDTVPEASAPPSRTATEAAIDAAGNPADAAATQVSSTQDLLRPDAPKQYTVKRGDTLWGIAGLFLKDPWTWPEIWYVNPDIKNPHLIYPGDVLTVAHGADGQPRITLSQASGLRLHPELHADPLDTAVPTIPYASVAAFLTRPSLVAKEEIKNAPYVLGFDDEHQEGGTDYIVYARGLKDAPVGARYSVVHVGQPIVDPENGKTLGYVGIYTGTAVVQRPDKITKTLMVDSARETLSGDPLVPDSATTPLNFIPHAPSHPLNGQIIAMMDGTGDGTEAIGQYDIVVINRGGRDGVGPGTVLAIDERGYLTDDRGVNMSDQLQREFHLAKNVRLPGERAGTLLVFKSYDRMSYALVVGASRQMRVRDVIHNP